MELLNESSALLSNYEVYTLLLDIQAGRNGQSKPTKNQTNLATVTYETVKYLESTSCKHLNAPAVKEFIRHLAPFHLTKAEKLQLLNQRPTMAVEIQLLIEESEERLTETQVYQLLDVVSKYLPDGSLDLSEESDDKIVYGDEGGEEEDDQQQEKDEELEERSVKIEQDENDVSVEGEEEVEEVEEEGGSLVMDVTSPLNEDSS
ncbi:DNA-directed RNA polymerase III subunit RPC9 [Octopus bimaculoides]|uniref:DNA-directed RNA polymerase III subunit RPC9 n=1 Tax=Octopus bimaculoides TaxID=37653 RepID=A0A0L8GR74_OCTBM|nr:DNA-directed RNA polymerase III subunit RPC9 [Octopus bimaculoides]|eukprot:XP_014779074.1 PREDICTED: DNA-directed RNA polymerase III subunit RPC9-like [Octopus bimaculoides]